MTKVFCDICGSEFKVKVFNFSEIVPPTAPIKTGVCRDLCEDCAGKICTTLGENENYFKS